MAFIGVYIVMLGRLLTFSQGANEDTVSRDFYVNDPRYIGCYGDRMTSQDQRVLPRVRQDITSSTPVTDCIRHCRNYNYRYSALQWRRECRCGNGAYDFIGACNGTKNCKCDQPCDGNPARYCGGGWANSVYRTRFNDTRYLGCFRAPDPKMGQSLLTYEVSPSQSHFSVQGCLTECAKRQQMYAGILDGSRCFCGNDTFQYRSMGACVWNCSCSSSCPNDPVGSCGGRDAYSIYQAVPDPQFEGCYTTSGSYFGTEINVREYTASECKYQCKKYYNYKYAALEYREDRWRCLCSNNVGNHLRCELDADCFCSYRCPANNTQICGGDRGAISVFKSGCADGFYGILCDQQCNCLSGGCNLDSGRCPESIGCASGWFGPKCDQACPMGRYGKNCRHMCSGRCLAHMCDRFTGDCLKCAPGMTEPPLCEQECSPGSFGEQCRFKCRCVNSPDCDIKTGACNDGLCAAGFMGSTQDPACQEKCSGKFGLECNFTCHCKHISTCNHVTGVCLNDLCEAGFHGQSCQQVCNETKFGESCALDCHCNGPCDRRIGCQECAPGWLGPPSCQMSARTRARKIAAGCLIPLFLIAIVFVFIYIILRKRKGKTPMNFDMTKMSFQNLKNTLKRRSGVDNDAMEDGEIYENYKNLRRIKLGDLESTIFSTKGQQNPFKEEYEALPKDFTLEPSALGLRSDVKKTKNRFQNVIPYDHSRVPLTRERDEASEYINASFMTDYRGNTSFIAAQGPSENTVRDFFRMLWEHCVPLVVMITRCVENGKIKCAPYWDEAAGRPKGVKEFIVTVIKENVFPDYTLRNLLITKGMEERTILHFHFTGWPDHGVPENANAMLTFRRRVRQALAGHSAPAVVHCSAGVGRTGTFLALDYLMDQATEEEAVDVFSAVEVMRKDRVNMVQNLDQYIFLYDALLEWHVVGFTSIPAKDYNTTFSDWMKPRSKKLNSKIQEQFRLLEKSRESTLKDAEKFHEYKMKDRLHDIVPNETYRVQLVTDAVQYGDYINAVFIDGYKRPGAFIATQIPLPHTRVDIWRMVKDYNISCIVCFTDEKDFTDKGIPYWPNEDEELTDGNFTVSCTASNQLGNLLTCVSSDLTLTYKTKSINYERHLRLLNVMWYSERDLYGPTSDLIELLTTVTRWQQTQAANTKVAVQSMYGCDKCGVFLAICNLIDMLNAEQEVDVFQVVKRIRKPRPQFIRNIEQYKYLYETVELYITGFHLYSNFS